MSSREHPKLLAMIYEHKIKVVTQDEAARLSHVPRKNLEVIERDWLRAGIYERTQHEHDFAFRPKPRQRRELLAFWDAWIDSTRQPELRRAIVEREKAIARM